MCYLQLFYIPRDAGKFPGLTNGWMGGQTDEQEVNGWLGGGWVDAWVNG